MEKKQKANRLASESSAYLRSASHQPIDWYPWSEEPFRLAKEQNKPVLLDIGAVLVSLVPCHGRGKLRE